MFAAAQVIGVVRTREFLSIPAHMYARFKAAVQLEVARIEGASR
jgi:hypothetical protein